MAAQEINGPQSNNWVQGVEEEEKEKDTSSVASLVRDFFDYTTAHGLGRVFASTYVVRRVFWGLLCIGAFVIFTVQILALYKKFQSRPLSTHFRMEHVSVSWCIYPVQHFIHLER